MTRASQQAVALISVVLAGCAGPRPILYPNPHLQSVGQPAAQADIDDCRRRAEMSGAESGGSPAGSTAKRSLGGAALGAATGAVGGAVVGSPGAGSAIGAAAGAAGGLLGSLFGGSPVRSAYVSFVNRCLMERDYDVVGWD